MEPPAKRSGRFDWDACPNYELAGLVASRVIDADNGSLRLAFQLACVNKALSVAVKTEVNRELTNLQSLYEDYRKLVLTVDKMYKEGPADDDPQWCSLKRACVQSFEDFRSKFRQLVPEGGARSYLGDIEDLHREQTALSARPDSNNFAMSKFGFTFEDYTLVAHMCRSVCMLSSSMSTLDNWVARRGACYLHFPFAQQRRLACIDPEFYFKHTMYPGTLHGRLPLDYKGKMRHTSEQIKQEFSRVRILLDAVICQFNDSLVPPSRLELATKSLNQSTIGYYNEGLKQESTELPFFPSAFVPRENSVAGRINLTNVEIKRAKEQAFRHEEALDEEKRAIQSIRLRRFNEDASAWLSKRGHVLKVEEVLRLFDDEYSDEERDGLESAEQKWEQTALSFLKSQQLGHPVENEATLKQLKLWDYQLKMRDKLHELFGEWMPGSVMVDLTAEPSNPPSEPWEHIPSRPVDDMAVAVWFVVDKLMCNEFKMELKGASHKDLRWSIDMGNGLKLERPLPGVDTAGRIQYERFDEQHIVKIFAQCELEYGTGVKPLSRSKIRRARELLCGMKTKGKNEKDWGAMLIESIQSLDREVLEEMGTSLVICQIFRIGRFPDIENALTELHNKWRTMQAAGLPDKCPLTTRDFVLELIGNPLKLPINYVHRPAPKPSAEEEAEREAKRKAIFAQIPEMQSSDEDDDMETEAGPSACYVPTSPQYSPTSPQYKPGGGEVYSPVSPQYDDAADAPEYRPV